MTEPKEIKLETSQVFEVTEELAKSFVLPINPKAISLIGEKDG